MNRRRLAFGALAGALLALAGTSLNAQLPEHLREYPLGPIKASGGLIAPFFDGWIDNGDGTVTMVFGFMNRNLEEAVDIPLGLNNHIEPDRYDGVQPTHFPGYDQEDRRGAATTTRAAIPGTTIPRGMLRERGAFAVTVPKDGTEVWWTLTHAGHTYSVPGRAASVAYEMSSAARALGSLNPGIRFSQGGPEGSGREGLWGPRVTASVGTPVTLSAFVQDRGVREDYDTETSLFPVTATWIRHQGPGEVQLTPVREEIDGAADWNEAATLATFTELGEYVIRIRIDNFTAPDSRFGNQCCWSNAYVPVTVTH